MSDLSERYGKCPDCGEYAVHLATREIVEFSGDQDDNLDERSVYETDCVEVKYGVTLFVHACFECGCLEDVGIEWPCDKVIDTREHQWTYEWPTEPGMYWFFGWPFGALTTDAPEKMSVEVFLGGDKKPVRVGGGNFMYASENCGVWTPANVPDDPLSQLEALL